MQQPPMQPPQIRPGSEVHPELNEKKFKFFSGLNILIALASISVQTASFVIDLAYAGFYGAEVYFALPGVWVGIFYFTSGVIGFLAAARKNTFVIARLVSNSSLSIGLAVIPLITGGFDGWYFSPNRYYYYCCNAYNSSSSWSSSCGPCWGTIYSNLEWSVMGISIAAIVSHVIVLVLAGSLVGYGCRRRRYPVPPQTMMMTNIASPTDGPQMGYYPPHQYQQPMSYPYYQPTPVGTAVQQQQPAQQASQQQPLDVQRFLTAPDGGQEMSDLPPNKEYQPSSSQSHNIVLPSTSQS